MDRTPPCWAAQPDLCAGLLMPRSLEEGVEALAMVLAHAAPEVLSKQAALPSRQEAVGGVIRVEHDPLATQRERTFRDRLEEGAVDVVGPLEREQLRLATGRGHDESVDRSAADRLESLLGLAKPEGQLLDLMKQSLAIAHFVSHEPVGQCSFEGGVGTRSRPKSTFSVSERSPTKRLIGAGRLLTSVGAAITRSPAARLGCL